MFDIGIASYLLNATRSKYVLNELAREYANIDIDDYVNKYAGETQKSNEQINLFSASQPQNDSGKNKEILTGVVSVYAIYVMKKTLEEKLKERDCVSLFEEIEMPLVSILADMQYTGIYVDKAELISFGDELKEQIAKLTKQIHELSGAEFNINSTKQLGEVLFEKLGLPTAKKTKSGYSTDVDVLEKIKESHPVVEKILEYRQLSKLNATYVEGLIPYINKDTNRIHSYFHQTIVATGRLSSSDPNLQNIPTRTEIGKRIRKIFKAEPGYIFADADYSQIELRVLAHIADEETMIADFLADKDIHKEAAARVFGTPVNEVTKQQRSQAKAVNFGIVYGISDFGLAEQLGIKRGLAKQYIEQYLEKYSKIKTFTENIVKQAEENGFVETLYKRRRDIPEIKSSNYNIKQFGIRVAMNTPIQGTAADIIKLAMIKVYNELQENKLQSKLVLQVHDELLLEVKKEEIEQVKELLKRCMEDVAKLKVPLEVDVLTGSDWDEAK